MNERERVSCGCYSLNACSNFSSQSLSLTFFQFDAPRARCPYFYLRSPFFICARLSPMFRCLKFNRITKRYCEIVMTQFILILCFKRASKKKVCERENERKTNKQREA